jgi:integrase
VSKRFSILAERHGQPGMRFHDLRHTHASIQIAANVPVNAIAQRLGHSTPNITLAVYGHLFKRSEDQAVAVAGRLLEGVL